MNLKVIVVLVCSFALACEAAECGCPKSPCLQYTLKECVGRLWNIPEKLSDNIKEFKGAVNALVENADDRLLGYLLSLSLGVVDYFTGMPTTLNPSCIYGTLLNRTLVSSLVTDSCATAGLSKARTNYGELCLSGIQNTIYVGMKLAGCQIKVPPQNSNKPCIIGSAPAMLLADPTSEIPASFKAILLKLATSSKPDEVAVAAAAFGTGTKTSIDFFQQLLCQESFKKTVQMKACKVKIPQGCCSEKEKELRYWVKILNDFTNKIMGISK